MSGKGAKSVSSAGATNTAPTSNKKNNKKKPTDNKTKSNGKEEVESKSVAPQGLVPPGFSQPRTSVLPPKTGFSEQQQRLLRHRALYAFRFLVGKAVDVQLVDGSRYIGILDCIDPDDFSIVLKNTQCTRDSSESFESGSTVIFKRRQLVHMSADGVADYTEGTAGSGPAAALSGFRTDTEISGRHHEHLYGRELQTASSWLDPQLDSRGLEDQPRRRSSSKSSAWNQFDANEKLFGVVSSFDENLYTTKLDKTKLSNEKAREAERLAKEIEREATGNFHLQEERGQEVSARDDLDEEARYSSVDRKPSESKERSSSLTSGTGAYIPPALRNASVSVKESVSAPRKVVSPKLTTTAPVAAISAPPAPVPAASAPAPGSQPRKPISFSEAVTGRPASAAASTKAAPASSLVPPVAADTVGTEKAPITTKVATSPKKENVQSPKPKATPAAVTNVSSPKTTSQVKGTPPVTNESKHTTSVALSPKKPVADTKSETKVETKETKETKLSQESTSDTVGDAPKKGLNPKAKEFKLSAAAVSFTPKFATTTQPVATSSPYRQGVSGHYGHIPPPVPGMAMGYHQPMPEEWMYEGGLMVDESEYPPHGGVPYMGFGVPLMPNPAMHMPQQPMYPMMHQNNRMHMGGRGMHSGYGGGGGGYMSPQQQPHLQQQYTPRSPYYVPVPGAMGMSYPTVVGAVTQPPLPPTPVDEGLLHGTGEVGEDGSDPHSVTTSSEVEQSKNE